VSNHTGISTIAKLIPNVLILSDALNHNSMIEAFARRAATARFSATTMSPISKSC
jgi:5-aminolevulinate synthase